MSEDQPVKMCMQIQQQEEDEEGVLLLIPSPQVVVEDLNEEDNAEIVKDDYHRAVPVPRPRDHAEFDY